MATRREKIILEIEDRGSQTLAQMAAQMAALDRATQQLARNSRNSADATDRQSQAFQRLNQQLASHNGTLNQGNQHLTSHNSLLSQVNQQLTNHNQLLNQGNRNVITTSQNTLVLGRNTQTLGNEFDRASGRVRLLLDTLLLIGPAAVPIGAVAVPALTGLASQAGIAVAAIGTLALAFQGVGDTVTALNEAALEPTGDNLAKAGEELAKLSPEARRFASTIGVMRDRFTGMRDAAAGGLFSQITDELTELDPLLGRAQTLLYSIGQATGVELAGSLNSLNSGRWFEFFDFLEREAAPTLRDIFSTAGDVAHGFAEMWMAFQPLNRDFGDWLAQQADDFDKWASRLGESDGFATFVEYIRDNGPRVAETMGAIGTAVVDLITAIAPLGGPVLEVIEAVAEAFSALAGSDIGTPLVAAAATMTLLARATRGTQAVMGSQFVGTLRQTGGQVRMLATDLRTLAGTTQQQRQIQSGMVGPLTNVQAAAQRTGQNLRNLARTTVPAGLAMGGLALAASGAASDMGAANTITFALMGAVGGPFGAAIGAGVGALMDLSAASDAAAQHQASLADFSEAVRASLNKQTAAAGDATRETVRQAIANADLTEAAREQGLTMNDLTDAVMGSEQAVASLQATVDAGTFELYDVRTGEVHEQQLTDEARAAQGLIEKINELGGAYQQGVADQQAIVESTGIAADRFDDAAAAIDRLASSWAAWNEQLDAVDAVVAYEQALDSLQESIATNGLTLDENTAAGQANLTQLTAIGRATQELVDSLPPAEKAAGLQRAREELYGIAREMGATPAIAEEWARVAGLSASQVATQLQATRTQSALLLDSYNQLPPGVQTDIQINGVPQVEADVDRLAAKYNLTEGERETLLVLQKGAAEAGIRRYLDLVRAAQTTRTTTIVTRYKTEGRPAPGVGMPRAYASGGHVTGPGGPRDDRIPAMLSNGEFVVNAAATSRHLDLLHAINSQSLAAASAPPAAQVNILGTTPARAYANGGLVAAERTYSSSSTTVIATEAGTRSVASAEAAAAAVVAESRAMRRTLEALPALIEKATNDGSRRGVQDKGLSNAAQRWTGGN